MDEELKQYLDGKFAELRVNRVEREASPAELRASPRMAAFLATDRALEALTESALKGWEAKLRRS